ncbi:hypothetical protein JKP88DRAFT_128954, partial [Tribonema minus]
TQSKRAERWSSDEHRVFLKAMTQHGRDWKKIKAQLPTRTLTQVRTHAYWYLAKVER